MRRDPISGEMITLEEDIKQLWERHGMRVIEEGVNRGVGRKGWMWTIRAEEKK